MGTQPALHASLLRYHLTHTTGLPTDPVRAFELRLVKQIVVAETRAFGGANEAFVRVEQIDTKRASRRSSAFTSSGQTAPRK